MTDILHPPPPQLASASSSVDDGLHSLINTHSVDFFRRNNSTQILQELEEQEEEEDQWSVLAALVTAFRKSLAGCRSAAENCRVEELMEIGWPTNVRHVAHVTFDRFNGFLGLPDEFEPEVPRRPPSASTRVFGVSTESMQLSFDSRGNCVPTILLMMQRRLYSQGGLQAEGIFRINAENGQEEFVREQLNNGEVPDNIEVHCLAGLIKAWFRELPRGVLDSFSTDEIMQAQSEEECTHLVRLLPPTDAALLDWAINLMADVAQLEDLNKMNARNIAMVFAPNMTQMADPLTALMYAVQVMNFLRTLIVKTLREREDCMVQTDPASKLKPSDGDDRDGTSEPIINVANRVKPSDLASKLKPSDGDDRDGTSKPITNVANRVNTENQFNVSEASPSKYNPNSFPAESKTVNVTYGFLSSIKNILPRGKWHMVDTEMNRLEKGNISMGSEPIPYSKNQSMRTGQSSNSNVKKVGERIIQQSVVHVSIDTEKSKELRITSRINSPTERVEAWR
ncbi:unnamed protein product [Fraxinus pennsylvanica]|uniref:Uncharacterized protein n=1 Tax=Fraxinus pennsylvanica TaxID=56036 RepID=A0AAD2DQJ5_9LAMI|nr:unnamed protein product [Fraxinus pennsylvanica]